MHSFTAPPAAAGPGGPSEPVYEKLVGLLLGARARFRLIDHAPEGRTEAASRLRRHALAQAAKCIVVRVALGRRDRRYVLAVVPGDRRVDLDKLRDLVAGTEAAFATREVAERLTGSVSGSIPPFAFDPELALLADPGLLGHREIYFNAARLDRSLALRTDDYVALARPRVAEIAAQPPLPPVPATPRPGAVATRLGGPRTEVVLSPRPRPERTG